MKHTFFKKRYFIFIISFLFLFLVGCGISKITDSAGNEIVRLDNVAFTIFGRNIYFYAIFILSGIGLAYFFAYYISKKIGFKEEDLFDGFIVGVVLAIIGARLYYVIFAWDSFKDNPIRVITGFINEEGGLAIHGAVIAVAIFVYFYWKKRRFNFYKLGEMLAPGFLIGQSIGRWGNFFNQEAHGGPIAATAAEGRAFLEKLPIPKFVVDQMYIGNNYMHPTFLYESVWNIIGLIIILVTRKFLKKYWIGDSVLFYLVWYGIGRYFVESLRTDYLPFNFFGLELRIAQVISVVMIIGGVTLFTLRRVFKVHPVSFIKTLDIEKAKLVTENEK
jgi:phosphatidylglycerol:prolipoprotein diacylglycerol transferase